MEDEFPLSGTISLSGVSVFVVIVPCKLLKTLVHFAWMMGLQLFANSMKQPLKFSHFSQGSRKPPRDLDSSLGHTPNHDSTWCLFLSRVPFCFRKAGP